MSDHPEKDQPRLSPGGQKAQAERLARQAAQLRANLQRRKAQARSRADDQAADKDRQGQEGARPGGVRPGGVRLEKSRSIE